MNKKEMARYIDQTTLAPGKTIGFVTDFCKDAAKQNFVSVCILPNMITTAAAALKGTDTSVCTVISFPLGADAPSVKIAEAKDAVAKGAREIDLVINVGALKSGRLDIVREEIAGVVKVAHDGGAIVKVIIEAPLLTDELIKIAALVVESEGAEIVKTSTGYKPILKRSTSVHDVKLIRSVIRPETGVKAAGGIRTTADAMAMIEAGATRIGASSGADIVAGVSE